MRHAAWKDTSHQEHDYNADGTASANEVTWQHSSDDTGFDKRDPSWSPDISHIDRHLNHRKKQKKYHSKMGHDERDPFRSPDDYSEPADATLDETFPSRSPNNDAKATIDDRDPSRSPDDYTYSQGYQSDSRDFDSSSAEKDIIAENPEPNQARVGKTHASKNGNDNAEPGKYGRDFEVQERDPRKIATPDSKINRVDKGAKKQPAPKHHPSRDSDLRMRDPMRIANAAESSTNTARDSDLQARDPMRIANAAESSTNQGTTSNAARDSKVDERDQGGNDKRDPDWSAPESKAHWSPPDSKPHWTPPESSAHKSTGKKQKKKPDHVGQKKGGNKRGNDDEALFSNARAADEREASFHLPDSHVERHPHLGPTDMPLKVVHHHKEGKEKQYHVVSPDSKYKKSKKGKKGVHKKAAPKGKEVDPVVLQSQGKKVYPEGR
ncbi:hypothetical protein BC830DRAFT_784020 [Chytriomyces sp. MP71]|nr:hypothetical protein BC830DRAFT_784020 [Chytriomyces sp. MP71]